MNQYQVRVDVYRNSKEDDIFIGKSENLIVYAEDEEEARMSVITEYYARLSSESELSFKNWQIQKAIGFDKLVHMIYNAPRQEVRFK